MTKIRRATREDAGTIAALGRATFQESFGHLFRVERELREYLDVTFSPVKIASSLEKENNAFWLAHAEGRAVGYAKLKQYSPTDFLPGQETAQLQKIYVSRAFHGHALGHALLAACIDEAARLGRSGLWLFVLESNARAVGFYQADGFASIGAHDFSIGQEQFHFTVMHRPLG